MAGSETELPFTCLSSYFELGGALRGLFVKGRLRRAEQCRTTVEVDGKMSWTNAKTRTASATASRQAPAHHPGGVFESST